MKIALVVPGGVDRSGEQRVIPVLLALITRLTRRHEVHVFALYQEEHPGQWDLLGARVHNIGARRTRWRAIRAIMREHRSGPFQLVQAIWSASPGLVAVSAARVLRIASTVHVAGGELIALPDIRYGGQLTRKGRIREALVLRSANIVTSASGPIVESILRLGIRARRVPLGVDLDAWPPREPRRRSLNDPARLIHVASLNRIKDQPTLLRALAELNRQGVPFHLDIVGEDTLAGEIQALSQRLGLSERVIFHGWLPQRQVLPLVRDSHLMLVSSRHETGPLVALEAAVQGLPTVGTAVGHIAEWSPEAAVAVPVRDWKGLAQAIAGLLRDEEQRLRIAREAYRRATTEDADYTARTFESIYGELTA